MSGNTTTPVAMSGYITPNYTFTPGPSGAGTVDLHGIDNFDIKRLVAIVNQTTGAMIYSSGNSSCNYTNVSGKIITLKFDTSSQSSSDILQIVYDTGYVRLDPVFPINIENCYVSNEVEIKNDAGSPVPVSSGQSGIWNINNISGSISLPTGAATEETVSEINNKLPTNIGQKDMANSLAVTIANDQSIVPISGIVTANIGTTNGLALNTTVDSLLKPSSTLEAVTRVDSITSAVTIKADTAENQSNLLKVDGSGVVQPISGSVSVTGTASVSVANFPSVQAVSAVALDVRKLTATDVVTITGGSGQASDVKVSLDGEQVAISNFPATQTIAGTVSVDQLPAGNNNIGDVDVASVPAPLNVIGAGPATSALRVHLSDESLAELENITVNVGTVEITNDAGNAIPVSAASLPLPTGAATAANQTSINTTLSSIDSKQSVGNTHLENIDNKMPALTHGRQPVEILGMPGVARQLNATNTSTDTALTVGVSRISIYANGGSIRYSIGSSAQTASNSSHFIAMGERLDIVVPTTAHIAVIRANSTNCTLEVTELV